MHRSLKTGTALLTALTLAGCAANKGDTAVDQMRKEINKGIKGNKKVKQSKQPSAHMPSGMLMPELKLPHKKKANEQRFDISVRNIPAQTFFSGLVSDTRYSIMVSPEINRKITVSLKNVTIPEVLSTVSSLYDLKFNKTEYGYEVKPATVQTEIFKINYLDIVRKGESRTLVDNGSLMGRGSGLGRGGGGGRGGARGGGVGGYGGFGGGLGGGFNNTPGSSSFSGQGGNNNLAQGQNAMRMSSSVVSQSESSFWKELEDALEMIVGGRLEKNSNNNSPASQDNTEKKVMINPQSGTVIVKATPNKLDRVGEYIDRMQNTMNRQVMLEAKIMEVTLNDDYRSGIDWNVLGVKQNLGQAFPNTSNPLPTDPLPPANTITNAFAIGASDGQGFNAIIRMLSRQGNVQVLSSPRLSTMNNQKAVMKIGTDSFFITGVENNVVSGGGGVGRSGGVDLQPFFSGLALSVTPQIAPDDDIILHIHPIVSKVSQKKLTFKLNNDGGDVDNDNGSGRQEIPTASSKIKESDNIVRAENGQMVVIAGLMETRMEEQVYSVPFLGKIPWVGALFRSTEQTSKRTEMVILLRPVVIQNGKQWNQQLEKTRKRYKELDQGFHFGTHQDLFGTEGEYEYQE